MKPFKNTSLLAILLLFFGFASFAQVNSDLNSDQSGSKIVGNLKDNDQFDVMYASIALVGQDSSVITGAISDIEGQFEMVNIQPGVYSLRIDHIEYKCYTTEPFTIAKADIKTFPNQILEPNINELGEVVVTYRKPLIEVRADKLIFNVSTSPSASGTNGLDLLRRSPGVTLDMDNNISLLGKSGVQIYINDVPSRLSGNDLAMLLQSMSSDNVEAIEIISNPSSKYEAEGNAGIINIRLKKNNSLGFNGSETSSFTQGNHLRYSNSLSLNYGGEKIKSNFEISQSFNKSFDNFLDTKTQNDAILDLDSEEIRIRKAINIGLGLEAQITENQSLNINGRSVINQSGNTLNSTTDIFDNNPKQLNSILLSQSIVDLPSTNHTLNLNHLWQLDKTSNLNTAVSLGKYHSDKSTVQPNTLLEPDGSIILLVDNAVFDASTDIDLWSAKTDFEKEWENMTFSTGLKYSHITTTNSFDFYNIIGEESILNPLKSNDFKYTENVAALYGILNVKLNKSLKLNAGIRIENTKSRGQLISESEIDNKDVPRNYTDFFPNVGLSFDNQKDHAWNISIGRRISRPNYQDLNPFETPISQLTVWKGNPFLRPNYIMNYQVSYTYKQKLILTNTYSVTNDFFANIFEITGENSNQIIPRNMEKMSNYGLNISYPLEVSKFWSFVGFAEGSHRNYDGNLEGTNIDLSVTNYNFRIQNNINLPWGITLDLTYFIENNWIWRGSINVKGNQDLNFGLRKNFLDKRLQVRITGADIFKTTNDYFYNGNYGGIDIDGVRSFDSQRFGLGITFKFGNSKAKNKRKTNSALDDELNRIEN